MTWDKVENKPLWRNWLARSAVNRKAGGSSPPRGATTKFDVRLVQFFQLYSFLGYFTLLQEVSNVMDGFCWGFFKKGHYDYNIYLSVGLLTLPARVFCCRKRPATVPSKCFSINGFYSTY